MKKTGQRIQRTFQNISDEDANRFDQSERLFEMGWYGSFTWDELLKSKRVLLISEAGTGKTYECKAEQERLWKLGEPAFYFELAELAKNNISDLLSLEEETRFNSWVKSQSDIATIFLDSIDELKLTLGSFETALKRLNKSLSGNLHRVRIIVTTRPIPIDRSLTNKYLSEPIQHIFEEVSAEAFSKIAMGRGDNDENKADDLYVFKYVALLPLSNEQIKDFALANGVSGVEELLASLNKKNAIDFARRPQDLIELCADWRDHKEIRKHREQVDYNIKIKLQQRPDREEKVPLSDEKAFEGASRLAFAALLERKFTIRHSAAADIGSQNEAALNPASVLPDWTLTEREVLLERPLFGFACYGRVRFHHRSALERLVARYLQEVLNSHSASIKVIKRLLFAEPPQVTPIVRPSMRPVAAWLAIDEPIIFEEVLRREPNILLDFGDPESFSGQQRNKAINAYVEHYGGGNWLGQYVPAIQVHRVATELTSRQALSLLRSQISNPEVRDFLAKIIEEVPTKEAADYAYQLVLQSNSSFGERLAAIGILVKLGDPRLSEVTLSMVTNPGEWPNNFLKYVAIKLFPDNVPAEELSSILAEIKEPRNHVSDLGYAWTRVISDADLTDDYLSSFRQGLTDKLVENIEWRKNKWPHLHSTRQHLIVLLALLCLRSLKKGEYSDGVLQACVIATRLYGRDRSDDKPIGQIRKFLIEASNVVREKVFWLDNRLIQKYHSHEDPSSRYYEIGYCGALSINSNDRGWILDNLSDKQRSVGERAVVLEAALRDIWEDHDSYSVRLKQISGSINDNADLFATFELRTKPIPDSKESDKYEKKWKKIDEQGKRKDAKNRASWMLFWKDVAENPQKAFDEDNGENTAWNLWRVMSQVGEGSRSEGWNRKCIEKYFDKETADKLRLAMTAWWRKETPTLYSERSEGKKDSYLTKWQFGLAAIYAESEDENWVASLSSDEAMLAARYVPLELSGFPSWLDGLISKHYGKVDSVIGSELVYELDELVSEHHHFSILQNISPASPLVSKFFVSRLHAWLQTNFSRNRDGESKNKVIERLRRVVNILCEHGGRDVIEDIRTIALKELNRVVDIDYAYLWLPILMQINAEDAATWLEKRLEKIEPSSDGEGVNWVGLLFDDRHRSDTQVSLSDPQFSPDILFRLLQLAYKHVRVSDDRRHDRSSGVDSRDFAEWGRSALVEAFLNSKGEEAWKLKLRMASEELFGGFRDRALFLAKEKEAQEVDGIPRSEAEVSSFLSVREFPPNTHGDLFSLLIDRLDDIEELLLQDDSPRETWAGIAKEGVMRREIARQLRTTSNKAYTVDQEGVTADEKETDIRLRVPSSNIEAVLELKLGDKGYSAKDLCDTIHDQLFVKYMASEECGSGCLLITVAGDRTWRHPATNKNLDITALEQLLNEEAKRIQNEIAIGKKIGVRILNLRPRLKTEKEASTKD